MRIAFKRNIFHTDVSNVITMAANLIMAEDKKYQVPDFGAWVKKKILDNGMKITQFAIGLGKSGQTVNNLLNSGNVGKPQQPNEETVRMYGEELLRLGLISSLDEAFIAAGFKADGYVTVKENRLSPPPGYDIPRIWQEQPEGLQRLLKLFDKLPPDEQIKRLKATADFLETMLPEEEK